MRKQANFKIRTAFVDPKNFKELGTFYLSQQPELVVARRTISDYDPDANWFKNATNYAIDVDKVVKFRRGGGVFTGVAIYRRPDSFLNPDELAAHFVLNKQHFDLGRATFVPSYKYRTADLNKTRRGVRYHITDGDVPPVTLNSALVSGSDLWNAILAARDHFDRVAASRALGAGNVLSHPILLWKTYDSDQIYWYARGYDAMCFNVMGGPINVVLANGSVIPSPHVLDVGCYSPYKDELYDISLIASRKSLSSAGCSDDEGAARAVAFSLGMTTEALFYGGHIQGNCAAKAHRPLIDPFGCDDSDCASIFTGAYGAFNATLPGDDETRSPSEADRLAVVDGRVTIDVNGPYSSALSATSRASDTPRLERVYNALQRTVSSMKAEVVTRAGIVGYKLLALSDAVSSGRADDVQHNISANSKSSDTTADQEDDQLLRIGVAALRG